MIFRGYKLNIIIRLFFIIINQFALVLVFFFFKEKQLFFISVILLVLLIFQIYFLFDKISITNSELSKFFFALKNSDFTINFSTKLKGLGFNNFQKSLEENIHSIKDHKVENKAYFNFLNLVIEKLKTGILSIDQNGKITLINNSAKDILGQHSLTQWNQVNDKHPEFYRSVNNIRTYSQQLIEINSPRGKQPFSVVMQKVNILGKKIRIISFQNIKNEIEIRELEAWNKLIKILNHEIMNSLTPLASLTDTLLMLVEDSEGKQKPLSDISVHNIADIRTCINTIKKRSFGLLDFVKDYQKLTKLPPPKLNIISLVELFNTTKNLMEGELRKINIVLNINLKENLNINGDIKLIEQVLINMVNNSVYALKETTGARIDFSAYKTDENTVLIIEDNGSGIPDSEAGRIFIPFYSTKAKGTGIGLSLCQQIMQSHKGRISLIQDTKPGACFHLLFPH